MNLYRYLYSISQNLLGLSYIITHNKYMTITNNTGEEEYVGDVDFLEQLNDHTDSERDFENPASNIFGVEVDSAIINQNDIDNLEFNLGDDTKCMRYPIKNYSYYKDGDRIDLVEVFILQNKITGEYFYYLDEPKLKNTAFVDDEETVEYSELKWYNRIKSDFDTRISNIKKSDIETLNFDMKDDISKIIDESINKEFAWFNMLNNFWDLVYDNILDDVVDNVDFIPEKSDRKYKSIPKETRIKIRYFLHRDYIEYGKVSALMKDPYIEDISCNGVGKPVFLVHSEFNTDLMSNIAYKRDELYKTMKMLANESGKEFNSMNQEVDGSLPNDARIQLEGDEVSSSLNFTIRVPDKVPLTPIDLLRYETFSTEQMVWLWLATEYLNSGIIAGGTASGKTTTLNSLSIFTGVSRKIVTIEDTRELVINNKNYTNSITRSSGMSGGESNFEVDMMELLRAALRKRPAYIFVGEVRGEEARVMFQAMASGHTSYSTFHASNLSEVKNRLVSEPINLGTQMLNSLDFVLNQVRLDNGRRVVTELQEIKTVVKDDDGQSKIESQVVSEFDEETRGFTDISWDDSVVINKIQKSKNWSDEELYSEINDRAEFLEYLVENIDQADDHNIEEKMNRYNQINSIIRLYMTNKELALDLKNRGMLNSADVETMINMIFANQNANNLSEALEKYYEDGFEDPEETTDLPTQQTDTNTEITEKDDVQ